MGKRVLNRRSSRVYHSLHVKSPSTLYGYRKLGRTKSQTSLTFSTFNDIQPLQIPHYLQTHLGATFGLHAREEAMALLGEYVLSTDGS